MCLVGPPKARGSASPPRTPSRLAFGRGQTDLSRSLKCFDLGRSLKCSGSNPFPSLSPQERRGAINKPCLIYDHLASNV